MAYADIAVAFYALVLQPGSFRCAWVCPCPAGWVESLGDFSPGRPDRVHQSVRGKAAWSVTWRRMTRRLRMNDTRSRSISASSAASCIRCRIA
jgi:hypothetical protein